jgi:hypothetical protein
MSVMRTAMAVLAVALAACGPTVGDACTTNGDCGQGTCLQGATAPGGYCSLTCQGNGGNCPNGSACDSSQGAQGFCRRTCTTAQDCRTGYTCTGTQGNTRICVGQ